MNFPFFIARRYIFSKKSTNAINVISGISVAGVAVATMAMVVTLSVFNGFRDLVASFFTSFDPQLKVVPVKGKTMMADILVLTKVKQLPEVEVASECLQDQALAYYHGNQQVITLKGVDDNFERLSGIGDILYGDGDFQLHVANLEYGVPGIALAQNLGLGAKWDGYLEVFAPNHEGQLDMTNPTAAFNTDSLLSAGVVFQVKQGKYDKNILITSIDFARRLFIRQGEITSLELRLKAGEDIGSTEKKIASMLGPDYKVMNRYEQQADTFRIMNIEKLIAYIFLTFILLVACFNIIGSLSMLIIDKKDDVTTLRNLGATDKQISQIFLFEGRLISAAGAVIGIVVGLLLCLLQQQFGLVRLGSTSGNFVVDAYPVSVHPWDVVIIFFTVVVVGWLAVWYPVRYLSRKK